MPSEAWAHAFAYVLVNEGQVYVEDPSPTLRGITLETLSAWRGKPCTAVDVRALTLSETQQIYNARYWTKVSGDLIASEAVATSLFDAAVNVGVGSAAQNMQQLAKVLPDGNIGPKSVAAINALDPDQLVVDFSEAQQAYYRALVKKRPEKRAYRKTWLKRAVLYQDLLS